MLACMVAFGPPHRAAVDQDSTVVSVNSESRRRRAMSNRPAPAAAVRIPPVAIRPTGAPVCGNWPPGVVLGLVLTEGLTEADGLAEVLGLGEAHLTVTSLSLNLHQVSPPAHTEAWMT